jgi:hypothetical protein
LHVTTGTINCIVTPFFFKFSTFFLDWPLSCLRHIAQGRHNLVGRGRKSVIVGLTIRFTIRDNITVPAIRRAKKSFLSQGRSLTCGLRLSTSVWLATVVWSVIQMITSRTCLKLTRCICLTHSVYRFQHIQC